MKLEEWKKFLDLIPDNAYTRELDYTQFEECETIKAGDPGDGNCFVLLDGKPTGVRYADEKKGVIGRFKRDEEGDPMRDKDGNLMFEETQGEVKIIKYKHKP